MLKKEIRKEENKKIRVKKSVQIRVFAIANPYHPRAIFSGPISSFTLQDFS